MNFLDLFYFFLFTKIMKTIFFFWALQIEGKILVLEYLIASSNLGVCK